jgi:hypothetical protein
MLSITNVLADVDDGGIADICEEMERMYTWRRIGVTVENSDVLAIRPGRR